MSDTIAFGTEAWIKQLQVELNKSDAYAEAAKNWEGDIYFIVQTAGSTLPNDVYMYLDLWHGECRQAGIAANPADFSPEFTIAGKVKSFKDVINRKIDPMKAMITGKLKLKGNMAKMMRNVKAANQLVLCCTYIPTNFPLE